METYEPTEKTLYTEPHSDRWGTWKDRLFQTGSGPRKGIGINVGGMVYVLPLKKWHELAERLYSSADKTSEQDGGKGEGSLTVVENRNRRNYDRNQK